MKDIEIYNTATTEKKTKSRCCEVADAKDKALDLCTTLETSR